MTRVRRVNLRKPTEEGSSTGRRRSKLVRCADCGTEALESEVIRCYDCGKLLCMECGRVGLCSDCEEVAEYEDLMLDEEQEF